MDHLANLLVARVSQTVGDAKNRLSSGRPVFFALGKSGCRRSQI